MHTDIKLPVAALSLVPHRPPFLLIDQLIDFAGQAGVVETVIAPGNLFLSEDGEFREIAMVEILAQSAAAIKGYSDLQQGREISKGFLVDIREFIFKKKCCRGDTIHTRLEITKSFSGFSVISGVLERAGEEVAAGSLKLWVPDESGN